MSTATSTLPPPGIPGPGDFDDADAALIARLTGRRADRAEFHRALVGFETAADTLAGLGADALTPTDMLAVLERTETAVRALATLSHRLIGRLQTETTPIELGAKSWVEVLAQRLRCSRGDAHRRIKDTQAFGLRRTLAGQPLPPRLPDAAAAIADGRISAEHAAILRDFTTHLPTHADPQRKDDAEAQLAGIAADYTPEQTRQFAHRLLAVLHPDGDYTEAERTRRRGIHIGAQDFTGMSPITGRLTPELRAVLDAILAKLAAPGMCNPDDEKPCVDGPATEDQITGDRREQNQRNHDALLAAGRALLASGQLGHHNGLPVTVVVSTNLQDLMDASGYAVTGGGTLVPMRDVIRMAAHSWHFLAVYDKHTNIPLYLGRSKRIATAGQRIMLTNRDLGCTFPGCTTPANRCQAHHCDDWHHNGLTNITDLALTCPGNHRMADDGPNQYSAHVNANGHVEWIPPPHLDTGGPKVNTYHHPDRLLPKKPKRPRRGYPGSGPTGGPPTQPGEAPPGRV
ncbi:MAG: HNH endonuclease signature motif containing protein [Mycolicibacterium insubricum]|nr:HNH endonuclease [Mycobacterium sp.]